MDPNPKNDIDSFHFLGDFRSQYFEFRHRRSRLQWSSRSSNSGNSKNVMSVRGSEEREEKREKRKNDEGRRRERKTKKERHRTTTRGRNGEWDHDEWDVCDEGNRKMSLTQTRKFWKDPRFFWTETFAKSLHKKTLREISNNKKCHPSISLVFVLRVLLTPRSSFICGQLPGVAIVRASLMWSHAPSDWNARVD